jgi:hypothetical protein
MQPPIRLPDAVRADLEAHRPGLADDFERTLAPHARPCVAITSRRVAPHPLRRGAIGRALRRPTSPPVLDVLASKFGGTPYAETPDDWHDQLFLGQIDLAEATAVLPPDHPRLTGILGIAVNREPRGGSTEQVRVRWFPEPAIERAVAAPVTAKGAWETRLDFRLAWTLPEGDPLEALWPLHDGPQWYDYERFFPAEYNDHGDGDVHTLLGNGPDEVDGFDELASHACLLRVPFDNTAGFHWGSNCVYVVVPRDELARGELGRAVAVVANA